jgi:hypothetical protein
MATTTPSLFHRGGFVKSLTEDTPELAFIEKYVAKVDSLDLSSPFHDWYSPDCKFYNTNGTLYEGGENVWMWMRGLFGAFTAVKHDIHTIRLIKATEEEWKPESEASWVYFETTTSFTPKLAKGLDGPIKVPRLLVFLVGKSEVEGLGTDGYQILEAKTWWDTAVFNKSANKKEE